MASFERKLEAFLEHYEQMKSVDNEEAFLKEFMVGATVHVCVRALSPEFLCVVQMWLNLKNGISASHACKAFV